MKKKKEVPNNLSLENLSNYLLDSSKQIIEKSEKEKLSKVELEEIEDIIKNMDNTFLEIEKSLSHVNNILDQTGDALEKAIRKRYQEFEKLNSNLDKVINNLKNKRLGVTKKMMN